MKDIFLALCFLFLTACGGGGGTGAIETQPVVTIQVQRNCKIIQRTINNTRR